LTPFRALREPDRKRRDEERPFRSKQGTGYKPKNHLTEKPPYKSATNCAGVGLRWSHFLACGLETQADGERACCAAQTKFVKRNDGGQVVLPELVVNHDPLDQDDVMERVKLLFGHSENLDRLLPVFTNTGIRRRYFCGTCCRPVSRHQRRD
jgi:hypothetical protein